MRLSITIKLEGVIMYSVKLFTLEKDKVSFPAEQTK